MAKYGILLALLVVGGFAYPAVEDDGPGFDKEMSVFFDHTAVDIEGRIVGGTTAANGAYPWMAAMTNGRLRSYLCGGSIVSNRVILTAAHCIAAVVSGNTLSSTLGITVGTNRWNSGGTMYSLQSHVNHPQYNAANIKNDLGILRAAQTIVIGGNVRTIPLNYINVGGGVAVRVAGYGNTRTGGSPSQVLLELQTTTVAGATCVSEVARVAQSINIRAPHVDPAIEICTFRALNHGTCNGDSGSALIRNSNNQQVGIVSWGLPCARGAPDMFVRVSAYQNWLRGVL